MSNRIEWRKGQYTTTTGYVNKGAMFTVTFSMLGRDNPKPWELETKLPGSRPKERAFATDDEAKEYAERFLVAWIRFIGAEFVESKVQS